MIRRLFLDHPASVGESYFEHASFAACFGWTMFVGSLACFVHALIPALCQSTGSTTVLRLHERLIQARARQVERDARSDSAQTAGEKQ
ncbi:MAG: DUF6356 family protein [Gammaproteobacteria bacterium]|nr:DUF6356 family protein [Gammaproteobacteria bacterium]